MRSTGIWQQSIASELPELILLFLVDDDDLLLTVGFPIELAIVLVFDEGSLQLHSVKLFPLGPGVGSCCRDLIHELHGIRSSVDIRVNFV